MNSLLRRYRNLAAAIIGLVALAVASTASATCQLNSANGAIKHVVYIEFDNVHFTRDNPNVPSDIEQMPNLLNFITAHGTLDAGDHTVLISHTANDILTTETGVYSNDHGISVANSFVVYDPGLATVSFPSSFFYWTNLVSDIEPATADNTFALTTPEGKNVPAPWVPFTRAGCDVGAFSTANIALERTPFDVNTVFGPNSPQAMESSDAQFDDFVGVAIHCTIGSPFCLPANTPAPDKLPDEPGGYTGYQALFGLKYVAPALGGITDYNGNAITGFAAIGFNPVAAQTLAVVEKMLEKGIPIVYGYIADVHADQENINGGNEFGPGEAGYIKQLKDYNTAFGTFFGNLKKDGIDQNNTLFIFTPDEGDHFVGSVPNNAPCDGVTKACTYSSIGELDVNLNQLAANAGASTPFFVHDDSAPTIYVPGQPERTDTSVRQLERTMGGLTSVNPNTGLTENLMAAMADPVEETMLHMVIAADPLRTPTFTFFGDPNFWFQSVGTATPTPDPTNAWNHGDFQPEIARTFIAIAGPGVKNLGVTQPSDFFTDHVDVRPTIMSLVGLNDDYSHDGRTILELLDPAVLPASLQANRSTLLQLGQAYKQINAPFGPLALTTLKLSTIALQSNAPGDNTYSQIEKKIEEWTTKRDNIAQEIKSMLEGAEFGGTPINAGQANSLISESQHLVSEANSLAATF